jgi:dephospho-CoA kinase
MLEKRYNERYEKYIAAADIVIDANGSIKQNTNAVKEGFLNENFGA